MWRQCNATAVDVCVCVNRKKKQRIIPLEEILTPYLITSIEQRFNGKRMRIGNAFEATKVRISTVKSASRDVFEQPLVCNEIGDTKTDEHEIVAIVLRVEISTKCVEMPSHASIDKVLSDRVKRESSGSQTQKPASKRQRAIILGCVYIFFFHNKPSSFDWVFALFFFFLSAHYTFGCIQ